MDKDDFIAAVKAAGIVGEGGAGFPAHVKYAASADTVIANGCECEPLLHTDQHIMRHNAKSLARALRALTESVGGPEKPARGVLALKKKHTELIGLLRDATAEQGLELFLLDDFYPAGDEQVLVREVTGRSVPPLGIPLAVNTVVANVGTLVSVDAAVTAAQPVTRKTLTVTGAVARPGVVRAPIGAPLADCLAACGGALPVDPVFIAGGPMMGRFVGGPQALARENVSKTSGGLIALPSGHPLHRNAVLETAIMRRRAGSACIQCRFCSDLCPRRLIGHPFETHRVMRAFGGGVELETQAGELALLCCECGICEHYSCPMELSPRRINQAVKASLREARKNYGGARDICADLQLWRDFRKIPVPRLAARIGIAPYMGLETPYLGDIEPSTVFLSLRQHIGAPAQPVVRPGDKVKAGDLIAEIPENALGARLHASIDGVVARTEGGIEIKR
ncbi:MAG: SLBB domain-containing protein [Desulfovibrio sp.]|jgi:Na+-translocating ferredoxin:NAD+ oxidoreductase RnfC subunit|nr:SLBB domain-containing protein [Desulfovibrio sp.]